MYVMFIKPNSAPSQNQIDVLEGKKRVPTHKNSVKLLQIVLGYLSKCSK